MPKRISMSIHRRDKFIEHKSELWKENMLCALKVLKIDIGFLAGTAAAAAICPGLEVLRTNERRREWGGEGGGGVTHNREYSILRNRPQKPGGGLSEGHCNGYPQKLYGIAAIFSSASAHGRHNCQFAIVIFIVI